MTPQHFDQGHIEKLLPHRGHALFVSRAQVQGHAVLSECCWGPGHPHLAGHFPDYAIVPGIFLIEAAAQTAGIAIAAENAGASGLGMLAAVRRALIHHPVHPGERITFELNVGGNTGNMYDVKGIGRFQDGRKAATMELVIAVRPSRES